MKRNIFRKYYWAVCLLALCVSVVSCKDDEQEIPVPQPGETVTPEEVKDILEDAVVEWGISREQVVSYMNGYYQIQNTGDDMLQFKNTITNQCISYLLHDGKLSGTTIVLPTVADGLDLQDLLNGYTCLGELDDCVVYENLAQNTMAMVWQYVEMENSYSAVGFSPIQSDAYEQISPIEVSISAEASENMFTATFSGRVSGVDAPVEAGFIYGRSENLSEVNGKKVSTNSAGDFTLSVKGLMPETTYYYCAYAMVDDFYYLGEVESFQTQPFVYAIDWNFYKMILVEEGSMPPFYMMQTELPPCWNLQIASDNFGCLNKNGDNAVTKAEFRDFLTNLREITGLPFRLPTRAEWEFAARGGNESSGYTYSGSNSIGNVGWYSGNSSGVAHDGGEKQPNELGFYDMSGNYAELTNDTEDVNYVDGAFCGGCWKYGSSDCKVTSWRNGIISSSYIPGTHMREKNAFNSTYITVRLVCPLLEE